MQVEAWLERAAAIAPTAVALEAHEGGCSYEELLRAARASAARLHERGARPGGRVAIALEPGIAFAQALHACMLLGAAAVPVDLRLTAPERERIAGGAAVLVDEPLVAPTGSTERGGSAQGEVGVAQSEAGVAQGAVGVAQGAVGVAQGEVGVAQSEAGVSRAESPGDWAARSGAGHESWLAGARHDLDAVAVVIHTSGTTSAPRPVELTYGNLLWSALGSAVALGLDPGERWLCALPLSHVGGLSILIRSAIYATTAVVHERFDSERVLEALRERRITLVSLVATTLARLLDGGLREPPQLRCALTGGGPVPAALVQRARAAGVPVRETYGLTECCSQAATAPPPAVHAGSGRSGCVDAEPQTEAPGDEPGAGAPLFCTRVQIAPDGEILLSGPTVAPGALAPDGRLHTGDLGRLDEHGFLHVTGRKADTIVTGGENVSPAEVEAVLAEHPHVLEAAVVGRPDPRWGEAIDAIVVVAAGARVQERALREHCAAALAPYKVPKRFTLVSDPLPRTPSGKLLRRELR